MKARLVRPWILFPYWNSSNFETFTADSQIAGSCYFWDVLSHAANYSFYSNLCTIKIYTPLWIGSISWHFPQHAIRNGIYYAVTKIKTRARATLNILILITKYEHSVNSLSKVRNVLLFTARLIAFLELWYYTATTVVCVTRRQGPMCIRQ